VFFTWKCIKIIFFLFLTSIHQNNLKLPKTINLKQKKNHFFFKSTIPPQKQSQPYRIRENMKPPPHALKTILAHQAQTTTSSNNNDDEWR